ncbi:unnamed protein product [Sphagnum jensenii]|uniref:Uncharacterized protein n=1 Tax=Sphagnum jensenii TaxID=128206 RepID=A0ABP0V5U4_9BRYO
MVVVVTTGGVSPYTFALDGSATYQASDTFMGLTPGGTSPYSLSQNGGTSFVPGDSLSSLCAGPYTILVKDAHGCTFTINDNITQPAPLALSLTSTSPASCYNSTDGQIVVSTATGGTPTYSYVLDNGAPQASTSFNASEGPHVVPGDTKDSATGLTAGTYTTYVTDSHNCVDTVTNTITQPVQPVLTIMPFDTTLSYGDTIQLNASFGPASLGTVNQYTWIDTSHSLSCINCPNPITGSTDSVNAYTLVVTYNNNQCTVSLTDIILVLQQDTFAIPTAFSPNGDMKNDTFNILAKDVKSFHMEIFNRWGETVFTTDDFNRGWDGTYGGKPQPSGVYTMFFTIEYGRGLAAGTMGGMVGLGGGLIIVPAMIYFMGADQKTAQGTSIAIMLPPVGLFAAINYYKAGYINALAQRPFFGIGCGLIHAFDCHRATIRKKYLQRGNEYPFIILPQDLYAHRKLQLTGTIQDAKDNSPLISAAVSLASVRDTNNLTGTFTDANGAFEFDASLAALISSRLPTSAMSTWFDTSG